MSLKEIESEKVDRIYVTDISEQMTTCCEQANTPTGSKNYGEFFSISGPCRLEKTRLSGVCYRAAQ